MTKQVRLEDDPAKRRTDIFFGLKAAAPTETGSRDQPGDAREPA